MNAISRGFVDRKKHREELKKYVREGSGFKEIARASSAVHAKRALPEEAHRLFVASGKNAVCIQCTDQLYVNLFDV